MGYPSLGELKETITFKKVDTLEDVVSTYRTVRARVTTLNADITEDTKTSTVARSTYEIWIRYLTGITMDMRVYWGTKVLTLTSLPVEQVRRQWMSFTAEELTYQEFTVS